jgi:hypothetical protein
VTLTPLLNENDGKGEYQLAEATCSCGWLGPCSFNAELAQRWADEHARHKNTMEELHFPE